MKKLSELNKEELYKVLMDNRKMNTDEQWEIFEEALVEFAKDFNKDDVKLLCNVFDEESECWDVLDNIVSIIDTLDVEDYLREVVLNTPNMKAGYYWAMQLNWRIFGVPELVERYIRTIINLEKNEQEKILDLLNDLKMYNSKRYFEIVVYIMEKIDEYSKNKAIYEKKFNFSVFENVKGVDELIKCFGNHILFNREGFSYFDSVLKFDWYKKIDSRLNYDYVYYTRIVLSSCLEWDVIGIKFIDVEVVSEFAFNKLCDDIKFYICKLKDSEGNDIFELRNVKEDKVLIRAKDLEFEVYKSYGRTLTE